MQHKNKFLFILLIILALTSLVNAQDNYKNRDILKINLNKEIINLNPIYAVKENESLIANQIFNNLVSFNEEGKLVPELASSWEFNEKADLLRFKLKDNIYFSNSKVAASDSPKKVDAFDWKASFEYLAAAENKSPSANLLKKIKGFSEFRDGKTNQISGINVEDKFTLEIKLKEAFTPILYNFAEPALALIPVKLINNQLDFSLYPFGTGAYKVSNLSKNKIILTKNKNYWKEKKSNKIKDSFSKIEIDFNNKKNNKNSYDIIEVNNKMNEKNQPIDSDFTLIKKAKNNFGYLAYNYNSGLNESEFNQMKKQLRYLLAEKIKMDKISSIDYYNFDKINNQKYFFFDLSTFEKDKISFRIRNLKDMDLNLATNNSALNTELTRQINDILNKPNNLTININKNKIVDYYNKLQKKDLSSKLFFMSYKYKNKYKFFYDNFYSKSQLNYSNYSNNRVDTLLEYVALEADNQKRKKAYQFIEKKLLKDHPFLFILQDYNYYIVNKNLEKTKFLNDFFN